MGLITIILTKQDRKLKDDMKDILQYSIMWAVGYLGMWILKWTIADVLYNSGTWKSALEQLVYRINGTHKKYGGFSMVEVIKNNFIWFDIFQIEYGGISGSHVIIISLIMGVIYITKELLFSKKYYNLECMCNDIRSRASYAVPYLIIAIIPIIWYIVLQNHSYFHSYFTYRNLLIFSLGINFFILSFAIGKKFENTK